MKMIHNLCLTQLYKKSVIFPRESRLLLKSRRGVMGTISVTTSPAQLSSLQRDRVGRALARLVIIEIEIG